MGKTLNELQDEIGKWGEATFPRSTPGTILAHLQEEIVELVDAWNELRDGETGDIEEAADCFLLLLHYCHRRGGSLFDAMAAKMAVNRSRTWKTDPEPAGHFKHAS